MPFLSPNELAEYTSNCVSGKVYAFLGRTRELKCLLQKVAYISKEGQLYSPRQKIPFTLRVFHSLQGLERIIGAERTQMKGSKIKWVTKSPAVPPTPTIVFSCDMSVFYHFPPITISWANQTQGKAGHRQYCFY